MRIHLQIRLLGTGRFSSKQHLYVFHTGEASRHQPRWQFGLHEDGRCGIFIDRPLPGMAWRHARHSHAEARCDAKTARAFLDYALRLGERFPEDCIAHQDLWADMSERGNAITRHKTTSALCLTIGVQERGQWLVDFPVAENSQAILESSFIEHIVKMVESDYPPEPDSVPAC